MLRALIAGITATLMAVIVPVYLCQPEPIQEEEPVLLIVEQPSVQTKMLKLDTGRGVIETDPEEYLTDVVLSEMPASFEREALKAQAVAARTFTVRQMERGKHSDCDVCADSGCCQAWTSRKLLEEKLGSSFSSYWNKVSEAVRETEGEVLYYGDELIDAVYFSCSGGMTEASVAVWGSDVPYLQSVESPGEESAPVYSDTVIIAAEEFKEKVLAADPAAKLEGSPDWWIGSVVLSDGGGVSSMEVGGVMFSGTRLRELFGLRSTLFRLEVMDGQFVFRVKGYGHRVGMSQYGANAMAAQGRTYDEILCHYYSGAEIRKHP